MRHLLDAVRQANAGANPYAALSLALTLPDICASIEAADGRTNGRLYIDWWNRYLLKTYTRPVGPDRELHTFMTGGDAYALRCALLHQGIDDVTGHKVRDIVTGFRFVQPHQKGAVIHRNSSSTGQLQLQVDVFCDEICGAVERWLTDTQGDELVQQRIADLMAIDDLSNGFSI